MTEMNRDDIKIISRHSNLSEKSIDKILKENIYNDSAAWQKFLRLFFMSLGVGFTTAGIIFFFAYNWADLHKFVKIGLIEGLIIVLTLVVVFSKLNLDIKNVLLTGTSVLVGVLFAVFGQIYQTGANAYDFFLGWTLFVSIWVLVANFPPLWVVYITLINTTIFLYAEQVAHGWSELFIFTLLFLVNAAFLVAFLLLSKKIEAIKAPNWFLNLVALAAIFCSTSGICIGISDSHRYGFSLPLLVLIAITTLLYGGGIFYGLKTKNSFYLSTIPFSLIIIITTFLIELFDNEAMYLFITLFLVGSVTFVIKNLLNLQKKWINE